MPAVEMLLAGPNGEDTAPLSIAFETIAEVYKLEIGVTPVAFPPANAKPGLFIVSFTAPWRWSKTANGAALERPAGEHVPFAPAPENFFYASVAGTQTVTVTRYLNVGEI